VDHLERSICDSGRRSPGHRSAGSSVHAGAGRPLVEGRARTKADDAIHQLEAPTAIRVGAHRVRGIRAAGDAPAFFVVEGRPIDEPDAIEIVPDFWPGTG
jgi:hypothetical protein